MTDTDTAPDLSTQFTVGEEGGTQPGGRRFTMTHANDGVVVEIAEWCHKQWFVMGTFELFADEVAPFCDRLTRVARNGTV